MSDRLPDPGRPGSPCPRPRRSPPKGTPIRSAVARVISVSMKPGAIGVRGDPPNLPLEWPASWEALQAALAVGVVSLPAIAQRGHAGQAHHPSPAGLDHADCTALVIRNAPRRCTPTPRPIRLAQRNRGCPGSPGVVPSTVGAPSSAVTRATRPPRRGLGHVDGHPQRPPAGGPDRVRGRGGACSSRSSTATANPSAASRCAVAAPIPLAAPVTIAVRPFPLLLVIRPSLSGRSLGARRTGRIMVIMARPDDPPAAAAALLIHPF